MQREKLHFPSGYPHQLFEHSVGEGRILSKSTICVTVGSGRFHVMMEFSFLFWLFASLQKTMPFPRIPAVFQVTFTGFAFGQAKFRCNVYTEYTL